MAITITMEEEKKALIGGRMEEILKECDREGG